MSWPGDEEFRNLLEDYVHAREDDERKRKCGPVFEVLFSITVYAFNGWRRRSGYPCLPFSQTAEDYCSEVCLALNRRICRWMESGERDRDISPAYLWRTAYGIIQDRYARDREEENLIYPLTEERSCAEIPSFRPGPESDAIMKDMLRRAIARLSPLERNILWRYHIQCRSMTEIGRDLGVSISKVSRSCARAMDIFREEAC